MAIRLWSRTSVNVQVLPTIEAPDPIEAIRLRIAQGGGLTVNDPAPSRDQPNRVHEASNRKRSLTLETIANLHRPLNSPVKSLEDP